MSLRTLTENYKCWNDCVPSGCPGHVATLEFQSVSDSLTLSDGRGQVFYIQTPELEVFMKMLATLSKTRVEIGNIVRSLIEEAKEK